MHASTQHLLQFFTYEHLPEHVQEISAPFCGLAQDMARRLPPNPETTACLRKLLEAKDCAVRSRLAK